MPSFGEQLRRERELREISLREVSEATKISLRYLQALERNDFEHLPGGLFNKGFVRAYCEFIGVDAESMVNAYLYEAQAQSAPTLPNESGLLRGSAATGAGGASMSAGDGAAQPLARARRRALGWIVLSGILALMAVGFAAWWFGLVGGATQDRPEPRTSGRSADVGDAHE